MLNLEKFKSDDPCDYCIHKDSCICAECCEYWEFEGTEVIEFKKVD